MAMREGYSKKGPPTSSKEFGYLMSYYIGKEHIAELAELGFPPEEGVIALKPCTLEEAELKMIELREHARGILLTEPPVNGIIYAPLPRSEEGQQQLYVVIVKSNICIPPPVIRGGEEKVLTDRDNLLRELKHWFPKKPDQIDAFSAEQNLNNLLTALSNEITDLSNKEPGGLNKAKEIKAEVDFLLNQTEGLSAKAVHQARYDILCIALNTPSSGLYIALHKDREKNMFNRLFPTKKAYDNIMKAWPAAKLKEAEIKEIVGKREVKLNQPVEERPVPAAPAAPGGPRR